VESIEIQKKVKTIIDSMNLMQLDIKTYEEFFHALMHIKPVMFIVEIQGLDDPYLKIIKLIKKSTLTKATPIVALCAQADAKLIDKITSLEVTTVIYPPIFDSHVELCFSNIVKDTTLKNTMSTIQDVKAVQSVMISGLASLAEYRDPETGEHIKRTQNYVKALAITLKRKGLYTEELTQENIDTIYMSVPLHDIGKVGIRDEILLKPGKLTEDEFEIMKTHTSLGHKAIMNVGSKLKNSAFLNYAADVAFTHHEHYDGTGYPRGLKGNEIPLVGRLMAVADVYDALITKRVYKLAMSHDDAMEIIRSGSGTHFDPDVVACALELEKTFQNISQTYSDINRIVDKGEQLGILRDKGLLKKILIVEDSRMVRVILKNQFEAMGIEVDEAVDGQDGMNHILKKDYDLVLLDIEMPNMNGYQMVMSVREKKTLPTTIAMTAADYNITISELRKVGVMGLILKPVDLDYLALKFTQILQEKGVIL
jgi:putative two-component system response regulator